jgi:hypothetical protein
MGRLLQWSGGVKVRILDFVSKDRGSNPCEAFNCHSTIKYVIPRLHDIPTSCAPQASHIVLGKRYKTSKPAVS